ncbi:amyloid-beta binding [Mactra antiquata]
MSRDYLVLLVLQSIIGLFSDTTQAQQLKCSSNFSLTDPDVPKCSDLLMGQYICDEPDIDVDTQQARGCERNGTVLVPCKPAPQIICYPDESLKSSSHGSPCIFNGEMIGFYVEKSCKWTNGYKFETALLLSIFLGMFGIDRFYLGYPAIGLLKFSTLGFFFLGQLIDVILIATQTVKPSDGSNYVIDYFGAGLIKIVMNEETIVKPDDY